MYLLVFVGVMCQVILAREQCIKDESLEFCQPPSKYVQNESLIFITPWNSPGYELSVKYAQKLDYISPVWFYIEKHKQTGKIQFEGRQDIKLDWLKKIRMANPKIKIVPRFYIEAVMGYYKWFIADKDNFAFVKKELLDISKELNLDGYVLDLPLFSFTEHREIIKFLYDEMRDIFPDKLLIGTLNGNRINMPNLLENNKDISLIEPIFKNMDKVIITTYDFPPIVEGTSFNSPKNYVKDNIRHYSKLVEKHLPVVFEEKVMIGMNFYGYEWD